MLPRWYGSSLYCKDPITKCLLLLLIQPFHTKKWVCSRSKELTQQQTSLQNYREKIGAMRLSSGDLNQQRWPILRWLVPWDFETAASIKDKDPQNGYGKPTQESPHTGQGLTMEELECMLAERPKRAPRERARTQSRKRERQNSLERTGTLRSREKLLLGRVVLVYFRGNFS